MAFVIAGALFFAIPIWVVFILLKLFGYNAEKRAPWWVLLSPFIILGVCAIIALLAVVGVYVVIIILGML